MAFLAGAATVGIAAVLAQAALPARLPSPRDWEAIRTLLERDARRGDAVLLSPPWAERAREIVPPLSPVLSLPHLDGEDLLGVRRVWALSLPEAPGVSRAREASLLPRASASAPPTRTGAVELSRLDLAYANLPMAFLPDLLAQAKVSIGEAPCALDGGAFRCPGEPPVRLAREVRQSGGAPRPCIALALGQRPGGPIVLSFPPVLVGRVLRGHAGALGAPSLPAPLRISIRIADEEAGAVELSGAGFAPFQVDTARFAGFARPIALTLTTPGAPAGICLDVAALP